MDIKIINNNIDCNVIDQPVYGGTIVAGKHARVVAAPRPADPLLQRPPLEVWHLPIRLRSVPAVKYWQQLYDEGFVDERCMSVMGRTDSAQMAQRMARALGIREVWKTFEALWGIPNLHASLDKGLNNDAGWWMKGKLDGIFGKE